MHKYRICCLIKVIHRIYIALLYSWVTSTFLSLYLFIFHYHKTNPFPWIMDTIYRICLHFVFRFYTDDDSGEKSVSVLLSGEESELIFIDHPYAEMTVFICFVLSSNFVLKIICILLLTAWRLLDLLRSAWILCNICGIGSWKFQCGRTCFTGPMDQSKYCPEGGYTCSE